MMLATEEMIPNRIEYRTTTLRPVETRRIFGNTFQLTDHPGASQALSRNHQALPCLKISSTGQDCLKGCRDQSRRPCRPASRGMPFRIQLLPSYTARQPEKTSTRLLCDLDLNLAEFFQEFASVAFEKRPDTLERYQDRAYRSRSSVFLLR